MFGLLTLVDLATRLLSATFMLFVFIVGLWAFSLTGGLKSNELDVAGRVYLELLERVEDGAVALQAEYKSNRTARPA